ncbi:hypothetical protein [Leifsonia sp. NPDC080035]|uniref:ABC transporter n=1 Tax=Leifsonia sp. NPDC080035 TaxID=3143936 RepID=A0AAU7GES6_9MICO
MSDTTPEPAPKPNGANTGSAEDVRSTDTAGAAASAPAAPATSPAESAAAEPSAAEPRDADPDVTNPPSSPVSARGHVNRPAGEDAAQAAPAAAAPAPAPAQAIEPEPSPAATEDDVAAAVARSTDPSGQPGATAAGSASVDTASPAQSATPVIAAAEAANLQASNASNASAASSATTATAAYGAAPAGEATWAPEPATQVAPQQPGPQPVAPIFLQRPEPPKKKSNRGVGILIALVGTVAFALLWVVAIVLIGALITPGNELLSTLRDYFTAHYSGWVPVVAFFIGMVVLIQIVNRARWWAYILGGLFVAVFVYLAYVGADLIDLRYWQRTPGERAILLGTVWPNPFAVVAGVLAREISIWTGAWLAARGRKLKARNAEAQADYEQQLADAQNQAAAAYVQQGY